MIFNKQYFEKVFEKPGAWGYSASGYEKTKYLRQLEAIKKCCPRPKRILEVGCAEGIHTAMIAGMFPEARVLCVDISCRAIERAKKTCGDNSNIELVEADIVELLKKMPERSFDIIIQSECLYYLFPRFLLERRMLSYFRDVAATMNTGGIFVTANGMSLVTRMVMGMYYRILKRSCTPVFHEEYRDWNELRKKYITYDIRVFRAMK